MRAWALAPTVAYGNPALQGVSVLGGRVPAPTPTLSASPPPAGGFAPARPSATAVASSPRSRPPPRFSAPSQALRKGFASAYGTLAPLFLARGSAPVGFGLSALLSRGAFSPRSFEFTTVRPQPPAVPPSRNFSPTSSTRGGLPRPSPLRFAWARCGRSRPPSFITAVGGAVHCRAFFVVKHTTPCGVPT